MYFVVGNLSAQGILGCNCSTCHFTPRSAMIIQGYQSTADFGAGALKVFRVNPGQTAPIAINVTDGHDRYAIGIGYPSPGVADTNRQLSYQPDPSWVNHSSTCYANRTTNVNQQWTFNLTVLSNAPPDFYLLTIQTAGITNVASGPVDEWNHLEQVYLQVAPTNIPSVQIQSPQLQGQQFSVRVLTTNGMAYTLQYKRSYAQDAWTTVAQIPGDGGIKTLLDTNAVDEYRFYRVRVE